MLTNLRPSPTKARHLPCGRRCRSLVGVGRNLVNTQNNQKGIAVPLAPLRRAHGGLVPRVCDRMGLSRGPPKEGSSRRGRAPLDDRSSAARLVTTFSRERLEDAKIRPVCGGACPRGAGALWGRPSGAWVGRTAEHRAHEVFGERRLAGWCGVVWGGVCSPYGGAGSPARRPERGSFEIVAGNRPPRLGHGRKLAPPVRT